MNKTIVQGLVIVALFFSTLFLLQQVDWMSVFKVKQITDETEQNLGDLFWELISKTEKENKDEQVINSIDSIITKICSRNNIDRAQIKFHVMYKDEVNAFALPGGHLIIYSGLILAADNQEELSGVICHEIAHIELHHVMKKLVKEIGLSALLSMTTGGSGSEMIKETAKTLSSSAFDRDLEKDADIKAVEYMIQANLNPNEFADFLYKLAEDESEIMQYVSWISTHPDTKERAKYIIEQSKGKHLKTEPILSQPNWDLLKEELKD